MAARQPDYKLSILDKTSDRKNPEAGAAWVNENGSISIRLNLCVTINSNPDLLVTLFPHEEKKPAAKKTSTRRFSMGKEVPSDDNIPF